MLRVMSFNVRGATADDGANRWEHRRDLNTATIQKYAPDIIGFQEVQPANWAWYTSVLTDYAYIEGIAAYRDNNRSERAPIFWRKDRLQMVDSGWLYLSPTPEQASMGWDASLERVATWVRFRVDDREFTMLNTHFDHRGEEARNQSAQLIANHGAELITGDFNAFPDSQAYNTFIKSGYSDTWQGGTVHSFHRFQGADFAAKSLRIDWILTKPVFRTISCELIRDAQPPLYPSDHYPVLATLAWASA